MRLRHYSPVIDFAVVWSGFNATVPARQLQLDKGDRALSRFA